MSVKLPHSHLQPTIAENYKNISFFPRDFHSYLMSREVGFTIYRRLGRPQAKKKGKSRYLELFCSDVVVLQSDYYCRF